MGFAAPTLLSLAAVRLLHRRGAAVAVAGGVAVAGAGLLGASVAGTAARDESVHKGVAEAPAVGRSVRAEVFETSSAGSDQTGVILNPRRAPPPDKTRYAAELDPETTKALPTTGFQARIVRGIVIVPPRATAGGGSTRIVALDDLDRWATTTSGRLPAAPCGARRCEAVYLGGGDRPRMRIAIGKLHIDVVGRARLDPAPVGDAPPRDPRALGADSGYYAVRGVREVAALRALENSARTYTWMRELDANKVHPWNLDAVLDEAGRARAEIVAGGNGDLTTPAPLLTDLDRRGRASSARILLIAGQAAAILLAFAAFAAAQRRRDMTAELDRLLDAGAARRHTVTLVAAESLALALVGAALAAVAVALAASLAGATDALAHAPSLPLLLAAVFAVSAIALGAGVSAASGRRRTAGEVAVWVALALIAWQAISRGALDASELAGDGGADPAILVLPTLVGLAGATLVLRALPALLHLAERLTRRSGAGTRLYALGLARNSTIVGATVAMVSIAAATGLFALAYAKELRTGTGDQAAYATGGDVRVRERPDVLPTERYRSGAPVIRIGADRLDTTGRSVGAIRMLGLPAGSLASTAGWRANFSDTPAREIDRRLGPPRSLRLAGEALPADARRVTLPVKVDGDGVVVSMTVQTRQGRFTDVQLLAVRAAGRYMIDTALPAQARGGRLVAIRVDLVALSLTRSDIGAVRLGTLRVDGRRVSGFTSGWDAGEGADMSPDNGRVKLVYPGFTQQRRFLLVHDQPGLPAALPALVSPDLASAPALDGRLPVAVAGQVIRIHPVATAEHFPTVPAGAPFAVVDAGALFAAVNLRVAGAALPTEMWLEGAPPALRAPTFRPAKITSRAALAKELRADPLGTVTIDALRVTALVSLGLAAVALLLSVVVALRDEAGELAELEALGIAPRSLRRQVRVSAATTALIGGAGAVVSAAVLSSAFLGLAHVTAEGRDPLPPLVTDIPWAAQALALALAAAVVAAAVLVVTRRALRGDRVGRLHG